MANYDKQERLGAKDRGYTYNYQPGRGLDYSSGTAFPGNWSQAPTPAIRCAGGCKGADLIPRNGICRQSLWRYLDLVPETEKTSVFSRATGKLADEHNVSLEYFWSRNDNATQVGPGTLTGLQIDPGTAFYPGNGITPGPGGFVLDPSRPVEVNWRQSVLGPRLQSSQNTGQRLLLGFDGQFAGWDYDIGTSYNQNKVVDHIHSGYVDDRAAALGIANGTLNPFGPQTDAGLAYLGSHALSGDFRTSIGRVKGLDARASREIGDWFGAGPAALALGGEFRKEAFHQDIQDFAGNVQSLGVDPAATVSGERNLKAQYAELNVPVLDSLELSAAIRHDKYSDFGSTSNPKYSFRFQPFRQLVLRAPTAKVSVRRRCTNCTTRPSPPIPAPTTTTRACAPAASRARAASPTATAPSSSTTPPAAIPTCDRKPRATLPWAWSTSRCATFPSAWTSGGSGSPTRSPSFPKRRSSPTRRPTPDASCARPTARSITSSPDWPTSAR